MSEVASEISIQVTPEYEADQSVPSEHRYVFSYHIHIRNQGEQRVQLLTRHWLITDGDGKIQEVQGDGVIGETPVIEPGKDYRYSSGAVLKTEVGSMQGHYGMKLLDDEGICDAAIPVFTLAVPSALH